MINIISKVDLKPLDEELYARPKPPKYLIMSLDTRSAICGVYVEEGGDSFRSNGDFSEARFTYRGIPIATCNSVPYGLVDIKD